MSDRTYFMRRAAQEQAAAVRSTGKARDAHRRMAQSYERLSQGDLPAEEPATAP
jgi:hypothetical protein